MLRKNSTYIDAIVHYCEINELEVDSITKIIQLVSKPLKEKIIILKWDATRLNFMKRTSESETAFMIVTPFETYQHYLSLKNHFTNPKYDFFKYGAKTRASVTSFNKRKDKYWFEKTSRKYSDEEVVDFLVSNFSAAENPQNLWIGEIINSGERTYAEWMRRRQSSTYLFKEQSNELLSENELESLFDCSKGHPRIFKAYLGQKLSLEKLRDLGQDFGIFKKTSIRS